MSDAVTGRSQISGTKWRARDKEVVKCNVGVAWDKDKKQMGAAWVARN